MAQVKENRTIYLSELYGEISIIRGSIGIIRDRLHPIAAGSKGKLDGIRFASQVRDELSAELNGATMALAIALDRINNKINNL